MVLAMPQCFGNSLWTNLFCHPRSLLLRVSSIYSISESPENLAISESPENLAYIFTHFKCFRICRDFQRTIHTLRQELVFFNPRIDPRSIYCFSQATLSLFCVSVESSKKALKSHILGKEHGGSGVALDPNEYKRSLCRNSCALSSNSLTGTML